jgi:hypothetical protein
MDAITASVKRFAREIADVGESTAWAMIARGEVETITIGKRRLVVVASYRRLVEERKAQPPQDARRNNAVPALGSGKSRGGSAEDATASVAPRVTRRRRQRADPQRLGPPESDPEGGLEVRPAEFYRERNRKIRRVLEAHFGKQNVSVTAGRMPGRVTARIDTDLGNGELIDLVRKLLVNAGITMRMAGRLVGDDDDPLDAAGGSYLWVRHRFDTKPVGTRSRKHA